MAQDEVVINLSASNCEWDPNKKIQLLVDGGSPTYKLYKVDNKIEVRDYNNNVIATRTVVPNSGYKFGSISGFSNGQWISNSLVVYASCTKSSTPWTLFLDPGNMTGNQVPKQVTTGSTTAPSSIGSTWGWSYTGYTFTGWKDGNGNAISKGGTIPARTSNYVIYAQWKAETRRITFSAGNGGTLDKTGSQSFDYGSNVTVTASPKYDTNGVQMYEVDYWNISWLTDPKYGNELTFKATNNGTVRAYFKKKKYTITAKADTGGKAWVDGNATVDYGTLCRIKAEANLGYKFAGWDDGSSMVTRNITVKGNSTYTATFSPKIYNVRLNTNGGKWGSEGTPSYTFITGDNKKTFDTPNQVITQQPTRFGYTFSGWGWKKSIADTEFIYEYRLNERNEVWVDDKPYTNQDGLASTITLFAIWTPINNTVKYHYYLGDTAGDQEYIDTKTYNIESTNPYRFFDPDHVRESDNITFLGWSTVKPSNWGVITEEDKTGHGNYPIPSYIPVKYVLPYEVTIPAIKTWGTTVDLYGLWTVTGKYIYVGDSWRKVNTAYVYNNGWKVVEDIWVHDGSDWKHEVIE